MQTISVSYKTRNTLILVAFVVTILAVGGYYVMLSYPKKINQLNEEIIQINQKISSLQGIEEVLNMTLQQIENEKDKLASLNKQITSEVTPASTYDYLNHILKYSGFVKFDMVYARTENGKGYGYNIYSLVGEASFTRVFRFIWYLERGPQIYRIKNLSLRGLESKDPDTGKNKVIVPFEMEIWALFADIQDMPIIRAGLGDVSIHNTRNPFWPFISRDLPANTENLLEVERATLRAVMPGKAFIANHDGKIHVLAQGDEVYLGYVTSIDATKKRVEFTLNKGGLMEKFTLDLQFGNTEE